MDLAFFRPLFDAFDGPFDEPSERYMWVADFLGTHFPAGEISSETANSGESNQVTLPPRTAAASFPTRASRDFDHSDWAGSGTPRVNLLVHEQDL